ncbi:FTR1 family protein [Gorillibacterium timonense]|uniref:hypothetical protein n=1 Tax=Gorillibacterium timonense TaxID=1689269 RepID=UPI00071CF25D|nr:hypothetical protein [Gorillibacterium timonense]
MSKLEYPIWSFAIVLGAVVLPPGLSGMDLALLLFRGSFAACLTLLALIRSEAASGRPESVSQARRGAGFGIAGIVIVAGLLAYWIQPLRDAWGTGWLPIVSASLMLSFGMKLHSSDSTAAWRQRVSFAAANSAERSAERMNRQSLIPFLAAGIVLRDGLESVLYIPALLLYSKPIHLEIGLISGAALVAVSARIFPRLPGRRPFRRLSCLMPALTLFLGIRLMGEGVIFLQREGLMDATPLGGWLFPTTWEWLATQLLLLLAAGGAAFRFRKRSNEFIRQINL